MKRIFILFLLTLFISGCLQMEAVKVKAEDTLVLFEGWGMPSFTDDMDKDSLKAAIGGSIEYLKRLPPDREFVYGPHTYTAGYLVESMNTFLDIFVKEN